MARAISMTQLERTKFDTLPLQDEWYDLIGIPERSGVWFIYGESGNGKTRFLKQLVKNVSQYEKVLYNSLEEGNSLSMKLAFRAVNMLQVKGRVLLLDREPMKELSERLLKPRTPKIIVIDSAQYTLMNFKQWLEFTAKHRDKLFIVLSHKEGNKPEGRTAKKIHYDASVKIHVEGYRAFCVSRYGGGKPYTIWEEGAAEYWSDEI